MVIIATQSVVDQEKEYISDNKNDWFKKMILLKIWARNLNIYWF